MAKGSIERPRIIREEQQLEFLKLVIDFEGSRTASLVYDVHDGKGKTTGRKERINLNTKKTDELVEAIGTGHDLLFTVRDIVKAELNIP